MYFFVLSVTLTGRRDTIFHSREGTFTYRRKPETCFERTLEVKLGLYGAQNSLVYDVEQRITDNVKRNLRNA